MAGNAGNNQRIIPLDEGWDDEIKAKVREKKKQENNNDCWIHRIEH